MAIHPRGMICVLTEEESDAWDNSGIRPDCRTHRHASLATAMRWHDHPKMNDVEKVRWAGRNALMVERKESRIWRTVYVGQGENGGPGMPVRQLVNGPAPVVDKRTKRYEGIKTVGGHRPVSRTQCRDVNG
jgi:hypothetical protein